MKSLSLLSIYTVLVMYHCYGQRIDIAEAFDSGDASFSYPGYREIASDHAGNVYTLQAFRHTYTRHNDVIPFIGGGDSDLALTKYDEKGNYLWTRVIATSDLDIGWSLTVDANNQIVFGFQGASPIIFEDTVYQKQTNHNCLVKLDTAGNFVKIIEVGSLANLCYSGNRFYFSESNVIKRIESNDSITDFQTLQVSEGIAIKDIVAAGNGDLIYTGLFWQTITLGSITLSVYPSQYTCFIFRVDSEGNVKWGERYAPSTTTAVLLGDENGVTYFALDMGSAVWSFGDHNYTHNGAAALYILRINEEGGVDYSKELYTWSGGFAACDLYLSDQDKLFVLGRNCGYQILPEAPYITNSPYFLTKLEASTGVMDWIVPFSNWCNCCGDAGVTTSDDENFFVALGGGDGTYQCTTIDYGPNSGFVAIKDTVPPMPVAAFWHISKDSIFSFHDSTLNGNNVLWDFGDGSPLSTSREPVHIYSTPGAYNVCLRATNDCGEDYLCKTVNFKGLRSIQTNHAGNEGYTTCSIYGGGFNEQTSVKLKSTGLPDVIADTVFFVSSGELIVRFNLTNQPLGLRDVEVTIPGDTALVLEDAFTIEPLIPFDPVVEIYGGGMHRTGRFIKFEVKVTNNGNTDAYFIPLLISGIPLDSTGINSVDIYPNFEEYNLLSIPEIDSIWQLAADSGVLIHDYLENNKVILDDSLYYEKNISFLIPIIQANSTFTIDFNIRAFFDFNSIIYSIIEDPLIGNDESLFLKSNEDLISNRCAENIIDLTFTTIGLFASGCAYSIFNLGWTGRKMWNDLLNKNYKKIAYSLPSTSIAVASAILKCNPETSAITTSATLVSKIISKAHEKAEAINKLSTAAKGAKFPGYEFGIALHCGSDLGDWQKGYGYSGAIDPNLKLGPQGYNGSPYINNQSPLSYQIQFENLETAAMPAQKIVIYDTLDINKVDMTTFQWGSFSIGDTIIGVRHSGENFVEIVDLTASIPYKVKVEGIIDNKTGALNWVFTTLDPVTLLPDTSFEAGFLPPNVNDPDGTGFVNYSVQIKSSVVTGNIIKNTAKIIFDYNAPIITNTWQNIVDITQPTSKINPLPPATGDTSIALTINGSDMISGIHHYLVFVSENDSAYQLYMVTDTNVVEFTGRNLGRYEFYSVAVDSAGNIEDAPVDPDNHPDAFITMSLGISEQNDGNAVQIIPNPADNSVTINLFSNDSQEYIILVTDMQGRMIVQEAFQHDRPYTSWQLNTSILKNGLYTVRVSGDKFTHSGKLVIMH